MIPSRHLLTWLQCSNSNYNKLRLPRFQLLPPRSNNAHAFPNHRAQSELLPCPHRVKRDHRQQFTQMTSPTRHYFRWWSHRGRSTHHLQGCPLARRVSLHATCHKTTSTEWTLPTWPSPSGLTIGPKNTRRTPSSTPSPEKKWNTWRL
jgi:hypothetical protein